MFTDKELDQLDARFKLAMEDKFDAYNEELNARQKEIERLRNAVLKAHDKTAELCTAWKYLANENARLCAALERIANWRDPDSPCEDMKGEADRNYFIYSTMRKIAREVLKDG